MNTLILEGSLGLDILQEAGQLFVSKPSLQAGDETLGFLGCLRTQVGQGRKLKLVQLLAHQQRDCVARTSKIEPYKIRMII